MDRFKDLQEELIEVMRKYIIENYEFNYADIDNENITIHLSENKDDIVNVYLQVELFED